MGVLKSSYKPENASGLARHTPQGLQSESWSVKAGEQFTGPVCSAPFLCFRWEQFTATLLNTKLQIGRAVCMESFEVHVDLRCDSYTLCFLSYLLPFELTGKGGR